MIRLIVFSRARPLQLHGYLTSLFAHWRDIAAYGVTVEVLMRMDPLYEAAYGEVRREFEDRVSFWWQNDFATDLHSILFRGTTPYTCFGTDDAVYTAPFDPASIPAAFRDTPDLLGYSLRLGRNIRQDMWQRPLTQPVFLPVSPTNTARPRVEVEPTGPYDGGLCWDASQSEGDWGYPWEVIGTVYQSEFVRRMAARLLAAGQANTPSQFEHYGSLCWQEVTPKRLMRAGTYSRLVVPTVNRVQDEFPNSLIGPHTLDPLFLLDCWQHGLRLDTQRYAAAPPPDTWRVGDFHLRRLPA